jgi:hypothetical protein
MPDARSVKRPGRSFSTKSIHPERGGARGDRATRQPCAPAGWPWWLCRLAA